MAGFATARTIGKLEQETGLTETPFSAVTAYHSEESKYACINSGMATYLPKPVVIADLLQVILPLASTAPATT
jgi:CheY-like chemotaxis protein